MQEYKIGEKEIIVFRSRSSIPQTDAAPPMPKVKPVKNNE